MQLYSQGSSAESQQLLLSTELYGQYVSLALRSEAVDTGNVTEITLERQNIGMRTSSRFARYNYKVD